MKNQVALKGLSLWLFLFGLAATLPAAVTDGLVFYVPFTSDMNDAQGGLEANVRGDATLRATGGIGDGYLHLENSTTIPDQSIDFADVSIGASDFSVSIWVRSSDPSVGQAQSDVSMISNKDWDSGNNFGWVLARGAGGANPRLQWNFRTPAGSRADFDPSDDNAIVFDGRWHHIVITHERAANASFYVDGALIGAVSIAGNAGGDINAAGLRLSLGNDGTGAYDHGDGSTYNGDLDEAALWTRLLTPDEINEIYNAGRQNLGLYDTGQAKAFFKSTFPVPGSTDAPGNTAISSTIQAGGAPIDLASIKMFVDGGSPVKPTVTPSGGDIVILYQPAQLLGANSRHTVRIEARDTATTPWSITNIWTFTVANYATLPTSYAYPLSSTNPAGFRARSASGGVTGLAGNLARARAQLDGTLIDPNTGEPYANVATPGPNPDGSYTVDTVNFEQSGLPAGLLSGDQVFPGLPAADNDYFATEAVGYLALPAGYYRFGVTSDDGFEVRAGTPARGVLSSIQLGAYDAPRSPAETRFDFYAPVDGLYEVGLVFFEAAGGASCELYSFDLATGERILINDPNNPKAIKSYSVLAEAARLPYVREVNPQSGAADVKVDTAITAVLVDGTVAVNAAAVKLLLNGAEAPVSATREGNLTRVTCQPAAPLKYKTAYTATLIFGDGGAMVTNQWGFTTRPADQKPSITGQWDFDNGNLSATIGTPLQYRDGMNGTTVAQTQFGTTTAFGIPDIGGVPAKVLRCAGAFNRNVGYLMTHGAVPNGGDTATKVNQWTLILDIMIPNTSGQQYFSFVQIDAPNNDNDGDLFANFSGGTAGLGISGSYPKDPPVIAGHWHRIVFAVDAAQAISKYVDGVKTADQTSWSGQGFNGRHAMNPTAILFADEDGESQLFYVNSIQFRNYKLSDAGVAALGGPSAAGIPTVSGQWDFDNGDLTATIGSDLRYRTDDTSATEFTTGDIDGVPVNVLHFLGHSATDGYLMYHGALPNGGGQYVNQYSLIMDILFPASSTGYRSLWQTATNTPTTTDGDLFVNGSHGIGISSQYQGKLTPDAWHRVAFTFDLTKRELGKYIDGANVLTAAVGSSVPAGAGPFQYLSSGVDGRWSLYDSAVLLADEDGELNECFINSLQFRVGTLTPDQVAALGRPSAGGIPANFPVPARLSIEWQAGELVITWPESVTGYTLQSSPAVGPAAAWTDITDVTVINGKNTALQTPNQPAQFYRLWK